MDKETRRIREEYIKNMCLSTILNNNTQVFVEGLFSLTKQEHDVRQEVFEIGQRLAEEVDNTRWGSSLTAIFLVLDLVLKDNPYSKGKDASNFVDDLENRLFRKGDTGNDE